jgi:hypothetical protein
MGIISKTVVFLLIAFATLASPIVAISASTSQPSTLPVNSFAVLFNSSDETNGVEAGTPFYIGIFCYDANNGLTTNFNGDVFLSVLPEGEITPSNITISGGTWIGNVTVTGTSSAVISVHDSQGHTGSSHTISILSHPTPSPTSSPPPTPYSGAQLTEQEIIIGVAIAVAVIGVGLGLLTYLFKKRKR